MKKLSFIFALVLAAGTVMAQKTTTSMQAGVGNTANVTQMACFSGDDNFIIANQSGDYNVLTTSQLGWDNNIDLTQNGNYNSADMKQETCDVGIFNGYNTSAVAQGGIGNTADLSQMETTGDANDGKILWVITIPEMDRSMNLAKATQSGTSNSYNLEQGRGVLKPENESYLVQSGVGNDADIDQLGIQNYSEIKQLGDYNTADLDQDGSELLLTSTFDKSYSGQIGNYNVLEVEQTGEVDEQEVESTQNGIGNKTTILQIGYTEQEVKSWQNGSSNDVDIDQIDKL